MKTYYSYSGINSGSQLIIVMFDDDMQLSNSFTSNI